MSCRSTRYASFNPLKSAYQSCHSTVTALLTLLNKPRLSATRGIPRSWPERCLWRHRSRDPIYSTSLDVYGVDGTAMNWLRSYLTQRSNMSRSARISLHPSYSALMSHRDPYLARSFSLPPSPLLFLPHISRLISNNIRGWHPAFHLNFKNQLCRPDRLPWGHLAAPHFLVLLQQILPWILKNLRPSFSVPMQPRSKPNTQQHQQVDFSGSPILLSDKIKLLSVKIDSTSRK